MRREFKYLVSIRDLDKLRSRILPFVNLDDYANEGNQYTVRSIYFDTSQLKFYYEKIDGIKVRKKLRIRGYNEQDEKSIVFLEIKRKYENFINKNRSALMYYNLNDLMHTKDLESYVLTDNGFVNAKQDAEKFLHHMYRSSLKPVVLIVYDREAYFSKFDKSLRITFDKNLRSLIFPTIDKLYSEQDLKFVLPKFFIFEIKFYRGFPKWLQSILTELNITRMALSKYTICLDHEKLFNPTRHKYVWGFTKSIRTQLSNYSEDKIY